MTLKTIEAFARKQGLETKTCKMADSQTGLFITCEAEGPDGIWRGVHAQAPVAALQKYLSRYKVPYEWRGHYTSILICEEATA